MTYSKLDFLLNPCGDLAIVNGELVRVTGADIIRQMWLIRVRTWKGEWVLDLDHGVPYTQEIFSKVASRARIEEIFRKITIDTPGVFLVESVEFQDLDIATRTMTLQVDAQIDGPEGASPITFVYDGSLPVDACTAAGQAALPLTIGDLRIWFDAQDLASLTYNSPLNLTNKAGTGDADGDCVLEGVSALGNKRSALFASASSEKLEIADTQAIRHGTGALTAFLVMKHKERVSYSGTEDLGILALNGYDVGTGEKEFYDFSYRLDGDVPDSAEMVMKSGRVGIIAPVETFRVFDGDSGVSNLSQTITLDGTPQTPYFWYVGENATVSLWTATVGDNLSITGAGSAPTVDVAAPFTDATKGVKLNNGEYYEAAASSSGDIGTEDYVLRWIGKITGTAVDAPFSKKNGATGNGYQLYYLTGSLYYHLKTGAGAVAAAIPIELDTYVDLIIVYKNGSEARVYCNGELCDTIDVSLLGSLTNIGKLDIGSASGSSVSDDHVVYLAMWKGASWLSTADQAAWAKEQHQILTGFYPQIAAGSAVPLIMQRDDTTTIEKYNGSELQLFQVGPNWLPFCYRDIGGTAIKGYRPQPQVTNAITESQDFSAWTKSYPADNVTDDQKLGPDNEVSMSKIVCTFTNGYHAIYENVTLTAEVHTFSVYVAPGDRDWIYLKNTSVTDSGAYFDVTNGVAGTTQAAATSYIDGPYVGGAYRCSVTFTAIAGSNSIRMYPADSDGDSVISGNGATANLYYFGAQVEQKDMSTALIRTNGATVTRLADELVFEANANIGGASNEKGQMIQEEWLPSFEPADLLFNGSISDGGVTSDAISLFRDSTQSFKTQGITAKTAGNAGSVVGPAGSDPDDTIHETRLTWEQDDLRIFDGAVAGTTDTSLDVPINLDEMAIGQDYAGTAQHGGVIGLHSIFDAPGTTPVALEEVSSTTTITGNFDSHILQFDISASGVVSMWVDGSAVTVSGTLTNRKLDGAGYVGCELDTIAADSIINFFEGSIGEILVWAENLDTDDSAAILAYLQEKWAL